MKVTIYADESGIHDKTGKQPGSKAIALAGFLGLDDDWAKFSGEWESILKQENVPCFHFSEFADKKNHSKDKSWPYYNWSEIRRDNFLFELANLIKKRAQFPVGSCYSISNFNKFSPQEKEQLGDPYRNCVVLFFQAFCGEMGMRWDLYRGEKISFVFDQTKDLKWRTTIQEVFNLFKTKTIFGQMMGEITFQDKKVHLPLQAADLNVYRLRQFYEKRATGIIPPFTKLDRILYDGLEKTSIKRGDSLIVLPWNTKI